MHIYLLSSNIGITNWNELRKVGKLCLLFFFWKFCLLMTTLILFSLMQLKQLADSITLPAQESWNLLEREEEVEEESKHVSHKKMS